MSVQEHFVCPDHGKHVVTDEDGCCTMDGIDCKVEPCSCIADLRAEVERLTRERDEAHAWANEPGNEQCPPLCDGCGLGHVEMSRKQKDSWLALSNAVNRLMRERDTARARAHPVIEAARAAEWEIRCMSSPGCVPTAGGPLGTTVCIACEARGRLREAIAAYNREDALPATDALREHDAALLARITATLDAEQAVPHEDPCERIRAMGMVLASEQECVDGLESELAHARPVIEAARRAEWEIACTSSPSCPPSSTGGVLASKRCMKCEARDRLRAAFAAYDAGEKGPAT